MTYYEETIKTLDMTIGNLLSKIKEQGEILRDSEDEEDNAFSRVRHFEELYAKDGEVFGEELDSAYAYYEIISDTRRKAANILQDYEETLDAVSEAREALKKIVVNNL